MNNDIQETKKIDILVACNNNTTISNESSNITKMFEDSSLIVINYPEIKLDLITEKICDDKTMVDYAKKGIISCSEFYDNSNQMHFEEPIKRSRTNTHLLIPDNKNTMNFAENNSDDDEFSEFIFYEQRPITPPTLEEIYKKIYEREES